MTAGHDILTVGAEHLMACTGDVQAGQLLQFYPDFRAAANCAWLLCRSR